MIMTKSFFTCIPGGSSSSGFVLTLSSLLALGFTIFGGLDNGFVCNAAPIGNNDNLSVSATEGGGMRSVVSKYSGCSEGAAISIQCLRKIATFGNPSSSSSGSAFALSYDRLSGAVGSSNPFASVPESIGKKIQPLDFNSALDTVVQRCKSACSSSSSSSSSSDSSSSSSRDALEFCDFKPVHVGVLCNAIEELLLNPAAKDSSGQLQSLHRMLTDDLACTAPVKRLADVRVLLSQTNPMIMNSRCKKAVEYSEVQRALLKTRPSPSCNIDAEILYKALKNAATSTTITLSSSSSSSKLLMVNGGVSGSGSGRFHAQAGFGKPQKRGCCDEFRTHCQKSCPSTTTTSAGAGGIGGIGGGSELRLLCDLPDSVLAKIYNENNSILKLIRESSKIKKDGDAMYIAATLKFAKDFSTWGVEN